MTPLDDDRTAAAAHRAERSVALDAAAPAATRPGPPGSCRRAAGRAAPDPNVHRAAHDHHPPRAGGMQSCSRRSAVTDQRSGRAANPTGPAGLLTRSSNYATLPWRSPARRRPGAPRYPVRCRCRGVRPAV